MKALRLAMGWGCLVALIASGQDAPLHRMVSVDYHGMWLADALKDLGRKAGVEFVFDEKLLEDADLVTCEGRNQEAGRVAMRILRPRGLGVERTDGAQIPVHQLNPVHELKVKREEVYEFEQKPKITREGDAVTIAFATKALCDVTVAIEDEGGRIVRHLASGVLGDNAPEPFQWNSRKQILVWDGKNDQGVYVDEKDALTVRVSLGLAPRYERSLYWEPKKRVSAGVRMNEWSEDVLLQAAPEGVYVFDGNGVDHLRLFDHDGNYARTIYPFPADKLKAVKGLEWKEYPQGYSRPAKQYPGQATFFDSGEVLHGNGWRGTAAFAMAVHPSTGSTSSPQAGSGQGHLALVKLRLSRLATDGSTPRGGAAGGLSLHGPRTWMAPVNKPAGYPETTPPERIRCAPFSAAFSPDGKRLYLAGYRRHERFSHIWVDGVTCLDYEGDSEPKVFVGSLKADQGVTPGVACDARGNVYVADYAGDRIQVYDRDAKLLKHIPVKKPAWLAVHPKTGEIYVLSWVLEVGQQRDANGKAFAESAWPFPKAFPPALTVLGPLEKPEVQATYPLPSGPRENRGGWAVTADMRATVDFWTEPPTIWLVPGGPRAPGRGDSTVSTGRSGQGDGNPGHTSNDPWARWGAILLQPRDGQLEIRRDFGKDTIASVSRAWSGAGVGNQFLYVNPVSGNLWVGEKDVGGRVGSRFRELLEIDPDTGKIKIVKLPGKGVVAEDLAFDLDGNVYLRHKTGLYTDQLLVRYELPNWREIPWDYGEERDGFQSALVLPCTGTVTDDESGLWVAPNGNVAVSCSQMGPGKISVRTRSRAGEDPSLYASRAAAFAKAAGAGRSRKYVPPVFPGRAFTALGGCVHIWDRHGRPVVKDAVPGMGQSEGLAMDAAGSLYLMANPTRIFGGNKHFNSYTCTLIKVRPGQSKWISEVGGNAPTPLTEKDRPKRAPDVYTTPELYGQMWVQGAEWFYGGVGTASWNLSSSGCHCWNRTRFALDLFARSFAPEMDQFSVAALDSNGNLILRVGQYGNVDDGKPLDPKGSPPAARSLGPSAGSGQASDEVALMHPLYVATHTDRRLFIGDVGNARIVGVKLGYHTEEKVALKDVKEEGKK